MRRCVHEIPLAMSLNMFVTGNFDIQFHSENKDQIEI